MIEAIEQWLADEGRDYYQGVELLEKFGNNHNLVRVYRGRSARFAMNELKADLSRLIKSADAPKAAVVPVEIKAIPDVVEKAKVMLHDIWVKLSKSHIELFEIGEENNDVCVEARLKIMQERDPLVERYNSIYEAKEAVFSGKLTQEQLQEVMDGKTIDEILRPSTPKKDADPGKLSDLQLPKKIKACKATINRAKNQLRYQQDTAAKKDNPMPDSPKRTQLEAKLKAKENELAELEAELKKRSE